MFRDLIEEIRLEARTKEQQTAGQLAMHKAAYHEPFSGKVYSLRHGKHKIDTGGLRRELKALEPRRQFVFKSTGRKMKTDFAGKEIRVEAKRRK